MPIEGIPVATIMITVTGLLTMSAFIIFGVTWYNMMKKRSRMLSKNGADELPADPTAVVVDPVAAQMSVEVEKNSSLGNGDQKANNEVDDTGGAKSEGDSDATIDTGADKHGATATTVDTTATAADGTTTVVDAASTTVDSSAVAVEASAAT